MGKKSGNKIKMGITREENKDGNKAGNERRAGREQMQGIYTVQRGWKRGKMEFGVSSVLYPNLQKRGLCIFKPGGGQEQQPGWL